MNTGKRWLGALLAALCAVAGAGAGEPVVLLHGLARSAWSMEEMAAALAAQGYRPCNVDYPSTEFAIDELARRYVAPATLRCAAGADRVHFVTHSMGGILVRYIVKHRLLADAGVAVGRSVMLSPPNRGSEVVDVLGDYWAFDAINGPAGRQLGTGEHDLPQRLGPATFEVGIITGSWSINPLLSMMIDGSDDGKVSIESAKLDGMTDFLVLPTTHTFIMNDNDVIAQTAYFLRYGRFRR